MFSTLKNLASASIYSQVVDLGLEANYTQRFVLLVLIMDLDLDLVIDSPDYSVEMKSGLKTLQGASDSIATIAETILTSTVPERKTFKGKVRTRLKESFKGSYGQVFSLEIREDRLEKKYRAIGWEVFNELLGYFLNESIYQPTERLSDKAQGVLDELGENAAELSKQLRVTAMKNLHDVSRKFDYDVKLRFRKNRDEQGVLAKFTRETGKVLEAKLSKQDFDITAGITRLNINTGNGRLQLLGEDKTIAFGFGAEYKLINLNAKKTLSDNLDRNNGLETKDWAFVRLRAKPMFLEDRTVVKYVISGFYDA